MNNQVRTIGLGLLVATIVSVCGATSAQAFPGRETRVLPVVPPPVITPVMPRLGIMGHIEYGWGMTVDSVVRGTTASRIGLERGDVILRINGIDITSDRAYRKALLHAVQFDNGLLKMQIADVRSGRRVFRTGYLNANPGIIQPRVLPHGVGGFHPWDDDFHHDHDFHHEHVGRPSHMGTGPAFSVKIKTPSVLTAEW